jgi:nicotinamidase-related amidase
MGSLHCPVEEALLVAVDFQPKFMTAIHEADRMVRRASFLVHSASLLNVPILATEQNATRMGGALPEFKGIAQKCFDKMSFSCWGEPGFQEAIESSGKSHIVLVGIETHICVTLTALDLVNQGYQVFVCPDAVSARTSEQHKLGMERMRDSGIMPTHTESLVYEWLGTASNPKFREALSLVKQFHP